MKALNWALSATTAVLLAGCGGAITIPIHGTLKAPEVDGTIVATPNKDQGFTNLKINLEHLAPPERLGGGNIFVIWTTADRHKWHRDGALKYDEGGRKAALEGVSLPVQPPFDLQISIEKDTAPETPSGDVILVQHVGG